MLAGAVTLSYFSAPRPVLQFTLTDHTGRHVTEKDFASGLKLVFFGFTGCSNICPVTLTQLSDVQRTLEQQQQKVKILFVTLDPTHDTPEALAQYLKNFDADIVGFTGSQQELLPVYAAFRVYAGRAEKNSMSDHSGFIYLVDASGHIVTYFTAQMDMIAMARLITTTANSAKNRGKTI